MWHVSIAPLQGHISEEYLRRWAFEALQGVGDSSKGQWEEWSGTAYHVKRRLSAKEQQNVGNACDIRKTEEAEQRRQAVLLYLPQAWRNWIE